MTQFQQQPQQFMPPPQFTPPEAPKRRRRWLPWAAGAGAFALGVIVGSAGGGSTTPAASSPRPAVTVTATAPAPEAAAPEPTASQAPATTAAPASYTPKKTDFHLTVKVLSKQCFGSAGCNVTYRVFVVYVGQQLDPDKEYEVLYEVRGGEDGAVSNTMTVKGTEATRPSEESVSTRSSTAKLTAVVTEILGG